MTIEIISIPNCPNHQPTVERVRSVVKAASLSAEVIERLVRNDTEMQAVGFAGSPTVLVNGRDLEPTCEGTTNFACRIYANGSGVPSPELVKSAIERAIQNEDSNESR